MSLPAAFCESLSIQFPCLDHLDQLLPLLLLPECLYTVPRSPPSKPDCALGKPLSQAPALPPLRVRERGEQTQASHEVQRCKGCPVRSPCSSPGFRRSSGHPVPEGLKSNSSRRPFLSLLLSSLRGRARSRNSYPQGLFLVASSWVALVLPPSHSGHSDSVPEGQAPASAEAPKVGTSNPSAVVWEEMTLLLPEGPPSRERLPVPQ